MPPKKHPYIEAVSKPQQDWRLVVRETAIGIVMIISAWGAITSKQAAVAVAEVKETVGQVQATVKEVKHQTDGVQTANLKTLAIAAENLAISTKTEKDKKAAAEAWSAYDDRVLQMQNQPSN